MKRLALVALLLASCASNPINMPECWEVRGNLGRGSSVPFMLLDGKVWLLTAKHNLPLTTAGGRKIIDQIGHPSQDLALISVEGTARTIRIARVGPKLGHRLYSAGYQFGALLITDGYKGKGPGRMSCPIIYGASGGPVWDSSGQLVGIIKGVWRMKTPKDDIQVVPHISLYVPVIGLEDWIKSITG